MPSYTEAQKKWIKLGLDKKKPEAFAALGASEAQKAEEAEAISNEAEAVLLHLSSGSRTVKHKCKTCDGYYYTTYAYNRYCSDACRREALLAIGIQWNPTKSARDRWGGSPPATVSPATIAKLKEWALKILETPTNPPAIPETAKVEVVAALEKAAIELDDIFEAHDLL